MISDDGNTLSLYSLHGQNPSWQRMLMVWRASGIPSINALAHFLGLKRSENLYQIRNGNNRISKKLALCIHEHFPAFPLEWLLYGDRGPLYPDEENQLITLPLYTNFSIKLSPEQIDRFDTCSTLARGATSALLYRPVTPTGFPNKTSFFLLDTHPKSLEVYFDRTCFICTKDRVILGYPRPEGKPDKLKIILYRQYSPVKIDKTEIVRIYKVKNILPEGLVLSENF